MTQPAQATPSESLTELQRQDLYLSELPSDFDFPLFSGRQAIESQRRSGYKSTARAVRELVDNSYESGAKNVWVALQRPQFSELKKHERKDTVTGLAVIDDGPGMLPQMIQYALSWGGGTHFKNPTKIAKFGFGLPNCSINQTRLVQVYSKTAEDGRWHFCELNIDDVPQYGLAKIPPPKPKDPPKWVRDFLDRKDIELKTGTMVVWVKPDRLTYSQATTLKQHLRHDFSVVYRGLLSTFSIFVEDDPVRKVDPLFLTKGAAFYVPPEEGGAICSLQRQIAVKFWSDEDTGIPRLGILQDEEEILDAQNQGFVVSTIGVKVARFPYGFVTGTGSKDTDPYKRFQIRKSRRGMAMVRAGREIDTIDAFPRSASDVASGLGDWPLLQSYAYHWGVEISFNPALDEVFGVGNDKQTISPIEDFWRVLTDAEIDKALHVEEAHQRKIRKEEKGKRAAAEANSPDKPNPATVAAAQAENMMGSPPLSDELKKAAQEKSEQAARELAAQQQLSLDEARSAVQQEARRKKFRIDFFDAEGGVFFKPEIGPELMKIAKINRAHPFFKEFYARLHELGDPRARQSVDLLLLALAKAELEAGSGTQVDPQQEAPGGLSKAMFYELEREQRWSPFLSTAMKILENLEHSDEEESEPEASAESPEPASSEDT
ncbi:MAG TPA: ATP-binding protein [Myxococcaceae bacterium]|nr:ATP-binding protein [Myxococcaceae bacterium]